MDIDKAAFERMGGSTDGDSLIVQLEQLGGAILGDKNLENRFIMLLNTLNTLFRDVADREDQASTLLAEGTRRLQRCIQERAHTRNMLETVANGSCPALSEILMVPDHVANLFLRIGDNAGIMHEGYINMVREQLKRRGPWS
jgi:hypothetical protein